MQKPEPEEYNPYFSRYISLVPEGEYMHVLKENTAEIVNFFRSISEDKHNYRYAEDKWSIKDILMHITDTERVMMYRALAAARRDDTIILCNMDENLYAANADVTGRTLSSILEEFSALRASSEVFFENLGDNESKFAARTQSHPITARAIGFIVVGHPIHHMQIIKQRY